jgi:hypothetical protein
MGRSLGVADSTADIDGGTITGISTLKTATGSTIGLYGKVPVAQRAYSSAVHATSALVTSAGSLFVASHLAAIQEIQLTLIGLGVYATA